MNGKKTRLFVAAFFVFSLFPFSNLSSAPQPVAGRSGQAGKKSTVNFLEIARLSFPKLEVGRDMEDMEEEGKDHMPLNRPVPPGAAIGRELFPSAPPPQAPMALLTPPPSASFAALGDPNIVIPPDVNGAAGPNHLMVTLNSDVQIQNRTGGVISTMRLNDFWAPLGVGFAFDPKILYDPYANRWMITSVADAELPGSSVLIGVSQSSDPTLLWNLYKVDADSADTAWADYPSFGFNKDWIVVQTNMFTNVGDNFVGSNIYTFDKADLYAGGAGNFTLFFDSTGGFAQTPAITYDTTLATMYLLEDWNGNSGGSGFLRLSTITGLVGTEVYTPAVVFPSVAVPWRDIASVGFADFAPQSGSSRKIMCNDARLQNTVYRNGFLWCAHTVFLPAATGTRASVQWWKINLAGGISQRGRMDDITGSRFYAFPSIAVNKNDAVLIGYSRFSSGQFAGGNYAYRIASDPANTLRNDTVLKAGQAKYVKDFSTGFNRWGDYTGTVVDPVNDVDMWTIQQYAAPRINPADRWGTWWGKIGEPAVVDCNNNGIEDSIDIFLGTSQDCNSSAVPDECELAGNDTDADSILNVCDNCPNVANRNQLDSDGDGVGDVCDNCPSISNSGQEDPDGDGRGSACDNCPNLVNPRGDMNGDLALTAADAVAHLTCVFLGTGSCDICFTDLNCDLQLTGADAVIELNAVFLGSPIPCTP